MQEPKKINIDEMKKEDLYKLHFQLTAQKASLEKQLERTESNLIMVINKINTLENQPKPAPNRAQRRAKKPNEKK